jgi:hypothetical protein
MGVFHLVEDGEKEKGSAILQRFNVYLDPGEVFSRMSEVQGKK